MEQIGQVIRPLLGGITTGLVVGVLVLDVMLPLELAAGMLYVALVIFSLWSPKRAFTLVVAAACTGLIVLDLIHHSPPEWNVPMAIVNRGLALIAIWATAILALLHTQTQEAIKTLQGLWPMCPGCKKIRDNKGGWQQLEPYLKTQSNLEFVRALCPECRTRPFPEALA